MVFSTNLNGKYNLWAMDLPNQFPYPLSFIDQDCHGLRYSNDGAFIICSFDEDGNENSQIYALPSQGGELVPLRYEEGQRFMDPIFAKDNKTLYYTSTKNNETYLNIYSYDIEEETEKIVLKGEEAPTYLVTVSEDQAKLVYLKVFANTYIKGYLYENGQSHSLTPDTDEQFTVLDAVFANDELYFVTTFKEDFSYLAKFDLHTHTYSKILSLDKEDVTSVQYSKANHSMYLVSSKGVNDYFYQYSLADNKLTKVGIPVSVVQSVVIAKSGSLYLSGGRATAPNNLFTKRADEKEWTKLTTLAVPAVKEEELVEPEIITYPSYDGLAIEALFFKPHKDQDNGYVIHWPHGGPQAAERNHFRSLFQFLVNRGYSIFAPNFRGSTGYGLRFMKLVEGDWGDGPRLDNIAGLDYLYANGLADKKKTLLFGGSYGGYMALLLHGRHSEYYKAVVDLFGPSDLFSFIESVPNHWKPMMKQWVGDPVKDKEKLIAFSPVTYLEGMTKPMLIIQGGNDPRVVRQESDQIVEALKQKGRNVEYLVLDDEGHGFSKKDNEIKVYSRVLEFFNQFIKEEAPAETVPAK
ncbi:S9 family peptidase [Heyndrickxia acidicola]|uniref:S9 family peptidase n=1 Tax=Heyndrickxia acidicola TaxID=209389 RepID=UPI002E1A4877